MKTKGNGRVAGALDAMKRADTAEAIERVRRLAEEVREGRDRPELEGIWESFRALLHRRGYFVDAPGDLAGSLNEIYQLGEGFDLHDLARALAGLDALLGGGPGRRRFPELGRFS